MRAASNTGPSRLQKDMAEVAKTWEKPVAELEDEFKGTSQHFWAQTRALAKKVPDADTAMQLLSEARAERANAGHPSLRSATRFLPSDVKIAQQLLEARQATVTTNQGEDKSPGDEKLSSNQGSEDLTRSDLAFAEHDGDGSSSEADQPEEVERGRRHQTPGPALSMPWSGMYSSVPSGLDEDETGEFDAEGVSVPIVPSQVHD